MSTAPGETTDAAFDEVIAFLQSLPAQIRAAAADGLSVQAGAVTADAQATSLYADDTGATRASTIAYVADSGGSEAAGAAYDAAATLNPDFAHVESVDEDAGDVTLVLTTFTKYTDPLITMQGGARDFIGPTITQHAGSLHDAAAQAIAALFGGAE